MRLQRDRRYLFQQLMMECAMHANMNLPANAANKSGPKVPVSVRVGGTAVRALFLIILTVLTARVASPQVETFRSMLDTPGDLIRVMLGFGVCTFFIVNLFIPPRDAEGYRTWMYLGPALLPLSVLCTFVVW
ncbi:hypothetical protein [Bradyrhizobium sp. S69]|uniref:hypothetical protein n=1 Tax=Bradyrhizobium sp. S69 TaxID=1641856 RepID=UPI00131AB4C0|nr:hypothetical protein [Bradyrhizobium sp. S69]